MMFASLLSLVAILGHSAAIPTESIAEEAAMSSKSLRTDEGSASSHPHRYEERLARAILAHNPEKVRSLILKGVNVNAPSPLYDVPHLTQAIITNQKNIAKLLIWAGANVDHQDQFGYTPLMIAARLSNIPIMMDILSLPGDRERMNKENYVRQTTLVQCILRNDTAISLFLIAGGADVSKRGWNNMTPIMIAGLMENEEILFALLTAGADKTIRDSNGFLASEHPGMKLEFRRVISNYVPDYPIKR